MTARTTPHAAMQTAQPPAVFYETPLGQATAALLRERLAEIWPEARDEDVLGIGHPAPYLGLWRTGARRCVSAGPASGGLPGQSCVVEEDLLPFADLSMDRVLLVHGLEAAENARRLLREVWRVLRDDGRLLVVAPNRQGVWAHVESTPFGQGQPYSTGQIGRLLAAAMFHVERRDAALFAPPSRLLMRGARLWEAPGRAFLPRLAGVTITEACKDAYAVMPLLAAERGRMVLANGARRRTLASRM